MMTVIGYRVFLMVGLLFCSGAVVRVLTQTNNIIPATAWKQSVPTVNVVGVVGGVADLPCDTSLPSQDDRVLLVLWYRDGFNTPVYSFDARKHPLRGIHQGQKGGGTSILSGQFSQMMSRLSLMDIRTSDAGIYRCRVDFKLSPTRNARVNLTVIVPPQKIVITDDRGTELKGVAGPFNENGILLLSCEAVGGLPPPKVTWWKNNRLVDSTSESYGPGRVRNTLRLANLGRADYGTNLTCQASNNNVSFPVSNDITIDMRLRPLGLKRVNGDMAGLSSDRDYDFECISWGGRPPALISWWKGNARLQSSKQSVSANGNMTNAFLTYAPSVDDQDKILSCRVEHPLLQQKEMELSWKLMIQYVPIARLELGSSLRSDDIKEGDIVYLECHVQAVPPVSRLFWRHNGKQINIIESTRSGGSVIMQNQTLIIQAMDRRWSGLFTCVASNIEGDGESNALALNVRFSPMCKFDVPTYYYVAQGELIQIPCEIQAYPTDLVFYWTFNGSRSLATNIPGSNFVSDQLKSTLSYRPTSEQDYGTLLCWTRNFVGEQSQPCIFQVLPASKPYPVTDCIALNTTTDSIVVGCRAGYDGGIPQVFHVQVVISDGLEMVVNRTSHQPMFPLYGLEANSIYEIVIWAENDKGRSEPRILHVSTLTPVENRTKDSIGAISEASTPTSSTVPIASIVGSVFGIASPLILAIIIVTVMLQLREKRHRDLNSEYDPKATIPLHQQSYDPKNHKKHTDQSLEEDKTMEETMMALETIQSMSDNKRMLSHSRINQNGLIKVDHVRGNRVKSPSVLAGSSSVRLSPPLAAHQSGYVRLPLVDQYPLIVEEENSARHLNHHKQQNDLVNKRTCMNIPSTEGDQDKSTRNSSRATDDDLLFDSPVLHGVHLEYQRETDPSWVGTTRF